MTLSYDKFVLVTGGAGFIGSHFLEEYVQSYPNHHFTCIDKLNYASNFSTGNLSEIILAPNFTFLNADLAEEYDFLYKFLVEDYQKNNITLIVNFAAESSVDRSLESPLYFTKNNILATQNLLECVRLSKERDVGPLTLLHISTDEVYGDCNKNVDESGTLNPTNPYAATKAAIDLIIHSYKYSYKLPVTVVRANNIYGRRQYPEKLIPLTLACLQSGRQVPIHGDGSNTRRFLHVKDFITGLTTILDHSQSVGETYNIGVEEEISNLDLIQMICEKYFNRKVNINHYVSFVKDRGYNDLQYSISCKKIRELGWQPQISLEQGIEDLIHNN